MLKVILIFFIGLCCANGTIDKRMQKGLLKKLCRQLKCTHGSGSFEMQIQQFFHCENVQTIAGTLRTVVQPTFTYLDMNGDSAVSKKEILNRTHELNIHSTELTKEENFKFITCDVNNDGTLDLTEYLQCSVWSYGIPIAVARMRSHHFSKTELTALVKKFSAYSYKTISEEKQLEVINSINPEPKNYSILDLATVDTKLLQLYLVDVRSAAV